MFGLNSELWTDSNMFNNTKNLYQHWTTGLIQWQLDFQSLKLLQWSQTKLKFVGYVSQTIGKKRCLEENGCSTWHMRQSCASNLLILLSAFFDQVRNYHSWILWILKVYLSNSNCLKGHFKFKRMQNIRHCRRWPVSIANVAVTWKCQF